MQGNAQGRGQKRKGWPDSFAALLPTPDIPLT